MTAIRPNELRALQTQVANGQKSPQDLVNWIMKNAAGKPYVWGGTGDRGFDCSGLVMQAFKGIGLPMKQVGGGNRSTTLINGTLKVPMEKVLGNPPLAGAVLYMPPGKDGIPHIGIYMGKGADGKDKVIESRGGKGVGVYNFSEIPWKVAGVVPGMGNTPPNLTELNSVQGGGQIGGAGDAMGDGTVGGVGSAPVGDTAGDLASLASPSSSPTSTADGSASKGVSLDKMLMDALWAQLDKKNAEAAAEKIKQMAPEASPEFAQNVAKLLMQNPQLAAAAKENPLVMQALLSNPQLADKIKAGMPVDQALAEGGMSTPEGGGTFSSRSAVASLVDLGGGSPGGPGSSAGGTESAGVPTQAASADLTSQMAKMRVPISA